MAVTAVPLATATGMGDRHGRLASLSAAVVDAGSGVLLPASRRPPQTGAGATASAAVATAPRRGARLPPPGLVQQGWRWRCGWRPTRSGWRCFGSLRRRPRKGGGGGCRRRRRRWRRMDHLELLTDSHLMPHPRRAGHALWLLSAMPGGREGSGSPGQGGGDGGGGGGSSSSSGEADGSGGDGDCGGGLSGRGAPSASSACPDSCAVSWSGCDGTRARSAGRGWEVTDGIGEAEGAGMGSDAERLLFAGVAWAALSVLPPVGEGRD